jgi:hypothetical protein
VRSFWRFPVDNLPTLLRLPRLAPSGWRRAGELALLLAVALLAGCGGEETPSEEPAGAEAAVPVEEAPADEPVVQQARQRFLPDEMLRPGGGPDFPHEEHPQISCTECHDTVRGHGSHSDLRCVQCHEASDQAIETGLTPADCMACHHAADQGAPCSACHEDIGLRTVRRSVRLGVWAAPRMRTLPFDHVRHETERCNACHESRPSLAATTSCQTCHEDHHRPDVRCMSCHEPPGVGAHNLQSHLGCTGSGCHSEPGLNELAQRRPTCLVCHQNLEQHEPGLECAECHRVRGEDALVLAWPGSAFGSPKDEHKGVDR